MKKFLTGLLALSCVFSLHASKIRVACVGDSITDGFGLVNPSQDSWPVLLGDMLGEGYEVKNFGQTGKTLQKNGDQSYWNEGKYKAALEFLPDIVIIKLGTNDAKEKNWNDPQNYKKDLLEFIESFEKLPTKPQIYIGTSAWVRNDAIGITAERVDKGVVPIQLETAKLKKLKVLDFNGFLRGHPEWYCDDIHPNEKGALKIAQFVYKALKGQDLLALPKIRGEKSDYKGYEKYSFKFRFRDAVLFVPNNPKGGKWVWVPTRFDGGNKFVEDLYLKYLKDGCYILHTDVDSWLGNPNSIKWGNEVLKYYKANLGFSDKTNFVAVGTGAFYAINFAAANLDKVESILLIEPVTDLVGWAGSSERNMKQLLQEWRLKPGDLGGLADMGVDNLQKIENAGIRLTIIDAEGAKE